MNLCQDTEDSIIWNDFNFYHLFFCNFDDIKKYWIVHIIKTNINCLVINNIVNGNNQYLLKNIDCCK